MGYGLWVTGYGLWVTGYGLWVTGYGLWVTGYGLWVTGYGIFEIRCKGKEKKRSHQKMWLRSVTRVTLLGNVCPKVICIAAI